MQNSWRPPVNNCAQCGEAIIAPVWAEHLGERRIRNIWSCEACGYQFETDIYLAATETAGSKASPLLH